MSGRRSRTWWSTPSRTRSSSRPSLHHGAPPATRQVAVDDPPGERAEREQQHARAGLVQQQLTHAEQHAVHQHASGHPVEEVGESVAGGLYETRPGMLLLALSALAGWVIYRD